MLNQVLVPEVSYLYGHFSKPTNRSGFENDSFEKSIENELNSQILSPIIATEESPTDHNESGSENLHSTLTEVISNLSFSISDSLDTNIIADSTVTPARHSWLSGHSCNTPCIQEINTPTVLDSTHMEGATTLLAHLQMPNSLRDEINFVSSTPSTTRNNVVPRLLRIDTD